MKVLVTGQHLDVGDSFRAYIEESLDKNVKKYFEHAINAHVTLVKEKQHLVTAEILINEGTGMGMTIKSAAQDFDAYRSFDIALDKVETQLKRYKGKIKNHHKNNANKMAYLEGKDYVISPFADENDSQQNDNPIIIAEKPTKIETLSVSDAVMKMDLLDSPALLFVNSSNKRLNVVYYRKDGNISWVDVAANA